MPRSGGDEQPQGISRRSQLRAAGFALAVCWTATTFADDGGAVPDPAEWPVTAMLVATVLWFFAIGASIGSFLNVVVYRLPLGLSLSHPPSRCPACETPIVRRDNVPVFGWLWLRGRCRACREPISPRYPLVEATVGGLFVLLLFVELASGGANLPVREPNASTGLVATLWSLDGELIGLYAYHTFLACLLVAIGLMGHDGVSIRRLLPAAIIIGCVAPILWPGLHPVPALLPTPAMVEAGRVDFGGDVGLHLVGLLDGVAGAIAGYALGALLSLLVERTEHTQRANVTQLMLVVGLFLGWQTAVIASGLAVPALALLWVVSRSKRRRIAAESILVLVVLCLLPTWRLLWGLLGLS